MEITDFIAKYGGDWKIKDVNQFMDILKHKRKTVWELEVGDKYWYISCCGNVYKCKMELVKRTSLNII